jgi:hypothetical protein
VRSEIEDFGVKTFSWWSDDAEGPELDEPVKLGRTLLWTDRRVPLNEGVRISIMGDDVCAMFGLCLDVWTRRADRRTGIVEAMNSRQRAGAIKGETPPSKMGG